MTRHFLRFAHWCGSRFNYRIMTFHRQKLLGIWIDTVGMSEAVAHASNLARRMEKSVIVSGNLNFAELAGRDPRLQDCNRQSALTVADGMPIVLASRWAEHKLLERIPGSELLEKLCGVGALQGHTFFFVGRREEATQLAIRRLKEKHPDFIVAGTEHVGKPITDRETNRVLNAIAKAKPNYLILALGQPQGELWIHEHLAKIEAGVIFQVGNALDLISGIKRRSPRWLGNLGLEWAYRMWQEPKRLGPRYLANGGFLAAFVLELLSARTKSKRELTIKS